MGLLVAGGVLVVRVLLVWGYLAVAERGTKVSELVGAGLAVLLVAMWVGYVALLNTSD